MGNKECSYRVEGICRCSATEICGKTCSDDNMKTCKYNGLIEKTILNGSTPTDTDKQSETNQETT